MNAPWVASPVCGATGAGLIGLARALNFGPRGSPPSLLDPFIHAAGGLLPLMIWVGVLSAALPFAIWWIRRRKP